MPIYDGNSVRFTADDFEVGTAQRAIAEAQSSSNTVASVAAPTMAQILDGLPHHKAYDRRIADAWRNPEPVVTWRGTGQ